MTRMRFAIALAVFSAVGFATTAAADSEADSAFDAFRIPRHRWSTWTVDFNGTGRSSSTEVPGRSFHDGHFSGGLGTAAAWFLDSDEFQRRLSVSAGVFGARRHSKSDETDSLARRTGENTINDASERLEFNGGIRIYPWSVPLGMELSGFGQANFSQSRLEYDDARFTSTVLQGTQRQEIDQSAFDVGASATIGLGRVRDASVVYRTRLLEERLLATGNLKRPLSGETRRKLEALFYTGPAFVVPHDRPEKFFWREIERILREDGALDPGTLDAYAVFRVIEPVLKGTSLIRNIGFFIGPSGSVTDQQALSRSNQSFDFIESLGDSVLNRAVFTSSDRRYSHNSFTSVGARAEYHRPLGMKWQVDASSSLQYADGLHRLFIGSRGIVSYLIADRWFADVSVGHLWDRLDSGQANQRDMWRLNYSGSLAYYIEDAWRLGISWNALEGHEPDRVQRSTEFTLGLTYHISGWLEVPGIVEPVRMLRQ